MSTSGMFSKSGGYCWFLKYYEMRVSQYFHNGARGQLLRDTHPHNFGTWCLRLAICL